MHIEFVKNGISEVRPIFHMEESEVHAALTRWLKRQGFKQRLNGMTLTEDMIDWALERAAEVRLPLTERICIIRRTP